MKTLKYIVLLLILSVPKSVAVAQTETLADYLEIAARNNRGLKADYLDYQASLQKIPQAGAIPDPQLDMGYYLKPMDIIDGSRVADFTLMQMFPWFGTRKAAQTEAGHMAKMTFEKFRESRDNLYLNVYTQWFILGSLQQKLLNNRESRKLLEQLEVLSIRKFSSPSASTSASSLYSPSTPSAAASSGNSGMAGMGGMNGSAQSANAVPASSAGGNMQGMNSSSPGMSDVLRVQLEIAELDNAMESVQSAIKAEKAKFNTLLNRPLEYEVHIPDSLEKIPFVLDIPSAMEQLSAQNPMLGMINEESLAYKAKAKMDEKMGLPMLGVGLQYSLIKKRMDMGIPVTDMNGMDMLMPMVSITIPVFRNKYKAQLKESEYRRQASREKYEDTYNMLEAELVRIKHLLDDASRQISLSEKQTGLALTTYNLVVQEFVTGKSDLSNVIQVQRQLLDYRLKRAEAVATYNTMVASAQRLISFNN
ncbi:MAG: TolC family protein [Petrimonas sp.]|uniref:TolC family protein n=1 Tax=Petrimonas sp. TaxID=2023866 RepID=UPI002B39AA03|nr:TolC family protein [Petrimonas sp.]